MEKNIIKDTSTTDKEDLVPVVTYEIEGQSKTVVNEKEDSEVEYRAKKFVDLVAHGEDPKKAAKSVGSSIEQINGRDRFGKAVNRLIGDYALDAKLQRTMVEAGLNKLFMEAVTSTDIEDRKLALATAKQIGQNLGLSPGDGVTIDLGGLTDVIKDIKMEGIPDFIDVTTKEVPDEKTGSNTEPE